MDDELLPPPPGPERPESGLEELGEVLEVLVRLRADHGELVRCPNAYGHSYLLDRPDLVRRFLTDPRYERTKLLKIALGEGSLSSEGETWRRQRRLVQPVFVKEHLRTFGPLMVERTQAMLARWEPRVDAGEVIEVDEEMMRLTLLIVVGALFSSDLDEEIERVSSSLTAVIEDLGALTGTLFGIPVRFGPNRNRRLRGALGVLDEIVHGIIERRRAGHQADADDLLARLLRARDDETGEAIDDARLRDELVTMLVAGHETTATMLAWSWHLLAQHPEAERRWHHELDEVLQGRAPTVDDMERLTYTGWIVRETLRLYPPVWIIARRLARPDVLDGYGLDANSAAFICPFTLHRQPEAWPEPERFEPERFEPERVAARPRYSWVPFGGGPHLCAGINFAMMEGYLILATVGQRLRLRSVPGHPVEPLPLVTLRQRHGLPMLAQRRTGSST